MNDIILMRHGLTNANKNYIVQGRMDNPLNKEGMDQAFATGQYLLNEKVEFDMVIASPLKRAFKTAELVNKGMRHRRRPIVLDKGLIERNFGDYDGKEINDDYYYLVKRGLVPNMETSEVLEERVLEALKDICKKYPDKKLLIVTHSHVIKSLLTKLVPDFTWESYLHNCSLNHIVINDGLIEVIDYNINPLA
ncbi:MAG: histidine phosphatase family protein [Tenericutes bacterium]|nr:histidine phosphatase family protein [Mycoplasmatota bacterium]